MIILSTIFPIEVLRNMFLKLTIYYSCYFLFFYYYFVVRIDYLQNLYLDKQKSYFVLSD